MAGRLAAAVPKAEFNDASALAPVPEGVVARVLDWCSAYRAGAAAATCKALRRAASLSAGVRAQKDAARPPLAARRRRVLRMARSVRFAGACVDGRRASPTMAEQPDGFGRGGPAGQDGVNAARCSQGRRRRRGRPPHFTRGGRGGARGRERSWPCPTPARRRSRRRRRLRRPTKADDDYRRRRRRGLDARTVSRPSSLTRLRLGHAGADKAAKEEGKPAGRRRRGGQDTFAALVSGIAAARPSGTHQQAT